MASSRIPIPANRCNFLAMYSILMGFLKTKPTSTIREAEAQWIERNKKWIGPRQTPRSVAAVYCMETGLTDEDIDEQLDWEFFEPDINDGFEE